MMKYEFHVGQLVRIGNDCPRSDSNFHKRGIVRRVNKYNIVVDMIDPFNDGRTHIDWCKNSLWEPVESMPAFVCKSLL